MNAGGVDKACKSRGVHHMECDGENPKSQTTNHKQITMTKILNSKRAISVLNFEIGI